ncbi:MULTISPECIES: capreomycidine synthase [unclassified Streptomyces]|uniref:capreomycidine synthase n=1 Tax=unclassified Streptomyces TaxID=2593676 RepID=UPI00332F91E0
MSRTRIEFNASRPAEPPVLEEWYRRRLDRAERDISSSGVHPYTYAELRRLTGLQATDLDGILVDDSTSQGSPELRRAIADRYLPGGADRVMVTHGSSEAIALTLESLLGPGDRVVLPDMLYHSLAHYPRAAGCVLHPVPLDAFTAAGTDPRALERAIPADTRAVIVNFPHNPTGVTLTDTAYRRLLDRVEQIGAVLVWDAATAEMSWDGPPLPDPGTRHPLTVSYGTFSKAFGLPGLRVGWCAAPEELIERSFTVRDRTTLFLSPLVEAVATAAMRSADALIAPRRAEARANLAVLEKWVADHQGMVAWTPPGGGVCCLLELPGVTDSERFCVELLEEYGTLLVPGTAFGREGAVRLGFGGDQGEFTDGLDTLSAFLHARGGR